MSTYVYIDDTGTSGLQSKSKFDSPDSKSWFALILNDKQKEYCDVQMKDCLDILKERYNAKEFHFSDIYAGRKEFKEVDYDERMSIFCLFAEVHKDEQFPMLMQTFSKDDFERNKFTDIENVLVDGFNLKNERDFSLYHLLLRINRFLKTHKYDDPFEIIIDEGKQKKDTTQSCKLFGKKLLNGKLLYKSSEDGPLLQLIDFVAYCLNRNKWILQNNSKQERDIDFVKMCSYANFNVQNIKKDIVDLNTNTTLLYDNQIKSAFDKLSSFPTISLKDHEDEIKRKNNE
jgi:hypothetical protein